MLQFIFFFYDYDDDACYFYLFIYYKIFYVVRVGAACMWNYVKYIREL